MHIVDVYRFFIVFLAIHIRNFSQSPSMVVEQTVWDEPIHVEKMNAGLLLTDELLQIETQYGIRELTKIEDITMVKPYEMAHASLSAIGSCIQEWNMGVKAKWGKEYGEGQVFFEAGTNQHNYTFGVYPNSIYCRASRLRFNDHGGLFDQNIRMMSNGREQTSYMVEDNLAISSQPLMIDNTQFKNDMCVFSEDGIYWSFIEFDGDVAVLNGCGEIYRFKRPENKESYMEEWVEFRKY